MAILLLALDFADVLVDGKFQITLWYLSVLLFLKALLIGGVEEIGWRYTFQPILEEKINYVLATLVTLLAWGSWHFAYYYIDGTLAKLSLTGLASFYLGLLINSLILSALYRKTKSLWICVMTHALINTLAQVSLGGNRFLALACQVLIIILAILVSTTWFKPRVNDF